MPDIHFVLVEPAVPENVGFSVRALKTMGFSGFRLVNPCDHLSKPARRTAYASHDILEATKVYKSFEESISDLDLTIATTAKKRTARSDIYHPHELPEIIEKKGNTINKVGIIFGREESGLNTKEINQCDIISTVPLATDYPSLNLAQSVLIYAYELSAFNKIRKRKVSIANDGVLAEVKKSGRQVLDWLELDRQPSLYQRILDRIAFASEKDIHLMLSVIKKLDHKRKSGI